MAATSRNGGTQGVRVVTQEIGYPSNENRPAFAGTAGRGRKSPRVCPVPQDLPRTPTGQDGRAARSRRGSPGCRKDCRLGNRGGRRGPSGGGVGGRATASI